VIAVIIPTLGRPNRVADIVSNLRETADNATPYFVIENHDTETAAAIKTVGAAMIINKRAPSYAGAVNTALDETTEPLLYVAADDFYFYADWLQPLLDQTETYGMCGSNDLHNDQVKAGTLATSFLIRRDYAVNACIDEPGVMLHEGYTHNFVDAEVTGTARSRGEYVYCPNSIVEHKHYIWGLAEHDETYKKTTRHHDADFALFNSRKNLWGAV
jgi:glycosyltransferase involved in cell wall biosynthesis